MLTLSGLPNMVTTLAWETWTSNWPGWAQCRSDIFMYSYIQNVLSDIYDLFFRIPLISESTMPWQPFTLNMSTLIVHFVSDKYYIVDTAKHWICNLGFVVDFQTLIWTKCNSSDNFQCIMGIYHGPRYIGGQPYFFKHFHNLFKGLSLDCSIHVVKLRLLMFWMNVPKLDPHALSLILTTHNWCHIYMIVGFKWLWLTYEIITMFWPPLSVI